MCGIFFEYNKTIEECEECFKKTEHRGPDDSVLLQIDEHVMGFHYLGIVHPEKKANQPFFHNNLVMVCNGIIFNYQELQAKYGYSFVTGSDCEIIIHLVDQFGIRKTLELIDGEFAFVIYDKVKKKVYAARDPIGVRPLFIGYNFRGDEIDEITEFAFASEMKSLYEYRNVEQCTSGHYIIYFPKSKDLTVKSYFTLEEKDNFIFPNQIALITLYKYIESYLKDAVRKRLICNVPVGCFLSGGLDSSLITSIAYQMNPELQCFTIGLENSKDVIAAKKVVKHLDMPLKQHHIVHFTIEEGIEAIRQVIYTLESYDTTTIRASVPQYLLSKYIAENTNVRTLLSGEGADELFAGYVYFRSCVSSLLLRKESMSLLSDLMFYDNLRTDRTTSAWGLEVRAPFLDKYLVRLIMNTDPALQLCYNVQEKMLLRNSFVSNYLPIDVLYRPKEAFSDAVSSNECSWYKSVIAYIETLISDEMMEYKDTIYHKNRPRTKEELYYRIIFEDLFPHREDIIPHFWMPKWQSGNIVDPSATVLDIYQSNNF